MFNNQCIVLLCSFYLLTKYYKNMKQMRTTFLLAFMVLLVSGNTFPQEVIAPAGAHFDNGGMSISWTVGELAIETFTAGDIILTQGFHQPKTTVVSVDELPGNPFNISAFPNPATDFVHIQAEHRASDKLHFMMYNFQGSIVKQGPLQDEITEISLAGMQPATYFIKVLNGNSEVQTFKLIKQ